MLIKQNIAEELNIVKTWLTVNRNCQFRCKWCYAEGTSYCKDDDMSFELAEKLIELQAQIGTEKILLIGGEPTLWRHTFDAIELIAQKGMSTTLVTNGLMLADKQYIEKLKASSLSGISISIKAGNRKQHEKITGSSRFEDVMAAVRNASKLDIPVGFSLTINSLVLNNIGEIAAVVAKNGANNLFINFCTTTFNNGMPQKGYMPKDKELIEKVVSEYDKLDRIFNGNVTILQTLPSCMWPQSFLERLENEGKLTYGCYVRNKSGLVFDTKGRLIVCNCLYDYPIGIFGEDFWDSDSFKQFWKSREVSEVYDQIITYPSESCIKCSKYKMCGGGCPLHWFVNEPVDIIPA